MHAEVPGFFKYNTDPFNQIAPEWEAHYNAEPFMPRLFEMDMVEEAEAVGFMAGKVAEVMEPSARGGGRGQIAMSWFLLDARK